jgi:hypothetical protein
VVKKGGLIDMMETVLKIEVNNKKGGDENGGC